MQKDALQKDYRNVRYEQPYQTAIYNQSMVFEAKRWHVSSYEEAILDLEPSQLRAFMPRLLHQCGVECYVTGNYSKEEALHLGRHVEAILKVRCSLLMWAHSPATSWPRCMCNAWLTCVKLCVLLVYVCRGPIVVCCYAAMAAVPLKEGGKL